MHSFEKSLDSEIEQCKSINLNKTTCFTILYGKSNPTSANLNHSPKLL
jgi:hypothetical protein